MQKIVKYFSISTLALLLFLGCEVSDFDLQENPNYLTPDSANPEYMLNEVQYLFQHYMTWMIINTDDIMRYEAMTDTYGDVVPTSVMDGGTSKEWDTYYEALNNVRTIVTLAEEDETLLFHSGIAKLLMGYLTVTMVDYLGAIPYSQAVNNAEYPNPELDGGAALYQMVLSDIDEAIAEINEANFDFSTDLFYGSDKDKWIAFANSFKLRILVQARLASADIGVSDIQGEINALLSQNLIDTQDEDFQYTYSTVQEPESRHQYFQRAYVSGFDQYIGNYFMNMLKESKSNPDPRIRYYLYRQSNEDPFSGPPYLPCQGDSDVDYCYVGDQYWGYDHGESRVGRGDNLLRTVYGIYPGGGTFDEDQFVDAPSTTNNLGGAGILPLLTSSYVSFLRAEAAITLGTDGNPAKLLETGIRASMDKVLAFGDVNSSYAATSADVDAYVDEVLLNYSNAATDEERLDIIMTEYYLAAFGNSVESYNFYRRTGYPSNIQVPIDDDDPVFPRSFPYSRLEVERNLSLTQKNNYDKVFWDTNPDGFIK
ncbi:MAG: SusD/RagB family nutrient-binding outer membrane lipoprotein [Muricauda sp.]|nr:SusD/RagB family nutrient-binding outer membrane lipoprotein [Allomuricauda sp.]MBA4744112.1 SusD/RagB family nutrient-binding outer membrane lipoprotein [Allomuricauda sp.]